MAQLAQEDYGQYSNMGRQEHYSGFNMEDQSEQAPPQAQAQAGYNPSAGQASWMNTYTTSATAPNTSLYTSPPVQPMYTTNPQFQQGALPF